MGKKSNKAKAKKEDEIIEKNVDFGEADEVK